MIGKIIIFGFLFSIAMFYQIFQNVKWAIPAFFFFVIAYIAFRIILKFIKRDRGSGNSGEEGTGRYFGGLWSE